MDIAVGKGLVSPVHDIVVGTSFEYPYQFFAVAAYHLAVAPCDSSRQQSYDFDVLLPLETAGELHRVVGDKLRRIDACRLTVKQFLNVLDISCIHNTAKLHKYYPLAK